MKTKPLAFVVTMATLIFGSSAPSQETEYSESGATPAASIPGPISDGTPPPPVPSPPLPNFTVRSTVTREIDVVQPPPMAGLPPVTRLLTTRVHLVEDPGLPDPPPALPPISANDRSVSTLLADSAAKSRRPRLVSLSATVYDHSRTLLRFQPGGDTAKEVTAWSNLDFNHFSGFSTFEVTGTDGERRKYSLFMSISNEDTATRRERLLARGLEYIGPEIPSLPNDQPAFLIQTENADADGVALIEELHALYRSEGARMAEAFAAREQASEEKRAYLLANPPTPKHVTVYFWNRPHPLKPLQQTETQGGTP